MKVAQFGAKAPIPATLDESLTLEIKSYGAKVLGGANNKRTF